MWIIYQQVSFHQAVVWIWPCTDVSSIHGPPTDVIIIITLKWTTTTTTQKPLSVHVHSILNTMVSPCDLHVPIMGRWVSFCSAINKNLLIVSAQRENAVTWLLGEDGPVASVVCSEKHISCSTAASKRRRITARKTHSVVCKCKLHIHIISCQMDFWRGLWV